MATLEKIIVHVHPMNTESAPYVVECEHEAPNFFATKLAERIHRMLKEEFVAEGVENIKYKG